MHTVFITGAAGYVGEMLCDQFAKRDDVRLVIGLDKEPMTPFGRQIPKLVYVQSDLADQNWPEEVAKYQPDVVIHAAWQIRSLYGRSAEQWRLNVVASGRLFDFALSLPSVSRLIHFSTAASYSARSSNTFDHYFTEDEDLRVDDYAYAKEKKVVEEDLRARYENARKVGQTCPDTIVVRPAAITGPRGRFMRVRFGLQSALSGRLSGGIVNRMVKLLTSFVPATPGWVRQFVHEDDVTDAIAAFAFGDRVKGYEVYNLTPRGEPVFAGDMAEAVGKKILPVRPWMVRLAFAGFWHLTRGRIPTAPGSWRFYSYPILMNGDKLAKIHHCRYDSKDAFRSTLGRYEGFVPETERRKS